MELSVGPKEHNSGDPTGYHNPEQREQVAWQMQPRPVGDSDPQGKWVLWGSFWQRNQRQTSERQASKRVPKEEKAVTILSWLTTSVPEEKGPTLATPRKKVMRGRGYLTGSKRPALARKAMTQEISSYMFILNYYIASVSHVTPFLEEFGF